MFLPDFSTHTFESKMATMAAFADAVKSYYSYMTLACGIHSLEIRGSANDWQLFTNHLNVLDQMFGSTFRSWFERIRNRVDNISDAIAGGSTNFLHTIFSSTRIGSGSELKIDGWFASDFFIKGGGHKLNNYPNTWSVVPFENIETGRKFSMTHGCFYSERKGQFNVPNYGYFTFELPKEAKL